MMDFAGLKRAYEEARERDEGSGEQEQETRARLLPPRLSRSLNPRNLYQSLTYRLIESKSAVNMRWV